MEKLKTIQVYLHPMKHLLSLNQELTLMHRHLKKCVQKIIALLREKHILLETK